MSLCRSHPDSSRDVPAPGMSSAIRCPLSVPQPVEQIADLASEPGNHAAAGESVALAKLPRREIGLDDRHRPRDRVDQPDEWNAGHAVVIELLAETRGRFAWRHDFDRE